MLSPYLTARIERFGVYATDETAMAPDAYDARRDITRGHHELTDGPQNPIEYGLGLPL
ncbi:hypothetical protein [Nocardia sp. NPDC004750]